MPAKQVNLQYQIPQDRGSLNAYQDAIEQPQITEPHEQPYVQQNAVNAARPIVTAQTAFVRQETSEHPTFSQVEPFLYTVADWMEFNRNEVTGHGRTA